MIEKVSWGRPIPDAGRLGRKFSKAGMEMKYLRRSPAFMKKI
jgi:hypothetical protein